MGEDHQEKTFLQDLIDRRFFRFVGGFLALSFGLIQFAQFLEDRYDLTQNLVEKTGLFLVIIFPAFLLFAYNHGRKGRDRWKPFEKIFIPFSLVAGMLVSLFSFRGQTLAAAPMEEVSIVNEEGETETRLVPAQESTRKLVSFPFTNKTGDAQLDWLEVGMPLLMDADLHQDMRIYCHDPTHLRGEYRSYGQNFPDPIPFASQLKIAQDFYTDFFVTGEVSKTSEGDLEVEVKVVETKNGKVFFEQKASGADFYDLADELSAAFLDQLYLPDAEQNKIAVVDLPVRDLISANPEAFKKYVEAQMLGSQDAQQTAQAIMHLQEAIELDETCGECHYLLANMKFGLSQMDAAKENIAQARRLGASLPERRQLAIRGLELNLEQEIAGAVQLTENWRKLYPQDLQPYLSLMRFYPMFRQLDKAKEVGHAALDNGHRGQIMTQLASLYIRTEDFDKAEELLEQFMELYPHKANETRQIAQIYSGQGKLDEAIDYYKNQLLMGNDEVGNYSGLSAMYDRQGKSSEALAQIEEGLQRNQSPNDSLTLYGRLQQHWIRQGQGQDYLVAFEKQNEILERIAPPMASVNYRFGGAAHLLTFGMENEAEKVLQDLKILSGELRPVIDCLENYVKAVTYENHQKFQEVMQNCRAVIVQNNGEHINFVLDALEFKFREDYRAAADKLDAYSTQSGASAAEFEEFIIEMYLLSEQYEKADAMIEKLLTRDPHDAAVLAMAAQGSHARGEQDEAIAFMQRALDVWSDAIPTYLPYVKARKFAIEKLQMPL